MLRYILLFYCRLLTHTEQSWGLRPRSYDKTGLRSSSVVVLLLYFWSCLKHCCARQALCDMIMLKCNKRLYFFRRNKCRNGAKCNWSSYHFFDVFCTKLFFITKMRVATEEFFFVMYSCWSWSWSSHFGLVSLTDTERRLSSQG